MWRCSGPIVSVLVSGSAVHVGGMALETVLRSQAGHFSLPVPLYTQGYKWILANLMVGVTLVWMSIPSRGVEILLVA